jgi:hypothetical protein
MKPIIRRVASLALVLGLSAGIGCDFRPNIKRPYRSKKPGVHKIHKKILPFCYAPRTNAFSRIEKALQNDDNGFYATYLNPASPIYSSSDDSYSSSFFS